MADDPAEGYMPLPWLAPSFTSAGGTITWSSPGNARAIGHNKTLSFCPGAIIAGTPQPFVVSAGDINSPLCTSLLISIANPGVFNNALHTGSNSNKDFGLHTFLKSALQKLEAKPDATWLAPFRPLASALNGSHTLGALPKSLTMMFGAHHASIYGQTSTNKTATLAAAAKDQTREAHARELMTKPIRPKILDEEFSENQKLLDDVEVEETPITLPSRPHRGQPPPAQAKSGEGTTSTWTKS
jgi:hypothetical protein